MRKIRRRSSAEEPSPPPPAPPPPAPPAPPARRTAAELVDGRQGVAAGLWGLAQRKLRDLRGRRWEAATERQRITEAHRQDREARKQAREELAKRIEKETGWRPSERTLRRHAAAGTVPRGVDGDKMVRQAAIDNAGGIARFARSRGMTDYAARKWRDQGGELPEQIPESLRFFVTLVATLVSKGNRYKQDQVWTTEIVVDGSAVARVAEAARSGEFSAVNDLVGQLAADQFPWVGAADRSFEVAEVVEISIVK
ncbi:MAG: hypothetical protein AB7G47_19395 [Mycolicibacterium sp.]|uniref:hypothetical protein n=1 Tax=Mycolicibacterium sp. TaxID=2320850 RepID=UPI003D130D6A